MKLISLLSLILFLLPSSTARAQCTSPSGVAGKQIYNSSEKIMQFCNGADWVAMKCGEAIGNSPCVSSEEGRQVYNAAHKIMQFCDGSNWIAMACFDEVPGCSLPWGGMVENGGNVTAYQNATEPFGGSCTSETRNCWNGTLDGTFTNQNCTVADGSCSLPWGGSIANGANTLAYLNASEPFGGSCTSQTRNCTAGSLSGTYTNQSCSVLPDPCAGTPSPGDVCADGSVYAGLSPDGNVKMFTTPTDAGQFFWHADATSSWLDTAMANCTNPSPGTASSCQTGEANTALLVALGTGPAPAPYRAARHCDALTAHGKSDWYLPAQDELNVLYNNHVAIGGFSVGSNILYHSSSETSADGLRGQRFTDGFQAFRYKSGNHPIRCVRKAP